MARNSSSLVVDYIRRSYNVLLGQRTATELVSKLVRRPA